MRHVRTRDMRAAPVGLLIAVVFLAAQPASAATFNVNDQTSLSNAITSAAPGDTINFTGNITLSADLPAVQTNVTIEGNNFTLNGAATYRGFFVGAWAPGTATQVPVSVNIDDLTIQNAKAQGGTGGGGGAGLGGAIFVASQATVTTSNLHLVGNNAAGGNGDFGGGGGGMGGNAGYGGGGGGLGVSASGGQVVPNGNGAPGIASGAAAGGAAGLHGSGGFGGANGGGGGVGIGGGGGGVGGQSGYYEPSHAFSVGGAGGFGGGGGTGNNGGLGGFGGGGGAGGPPSVFYASGNGNDGGFGGGGGPSADTPSPYVPARRSSGGFGGGNGGGGTTGFSGGGGGAGMGGAIFVQQGGSLNIAGPLTVNGNAVAPGLGYSGGTDGSAFGSGLFLQGNGTITFSPGSGQTQTVSDVITDQSGSGGTGANAGSYALVKTGAGTLILGGANSYSGGTNVNAGTLVVNGSIGATTVNGGTLMGTGAVGNTVVNSGGTVYPGTIGSPLSINGTFTQNAGSRYLADVSPTGSDKIIVSGAATIQSGATFQANFAPGRYTPGMHYTLLTAASVSGQYTMLPSLGAGLVAALQYDPADIQLTISAFRFSTYALTFNQAGVAGAFDQSAVGSSGDFASVAMQLQSLSTRQLPGAYAQLAGDLYPSLASIDLQTTTASMQLISNRLAGALSPIMLGSIVPVGFASNDQYDGDVRLVSYQDPDGQQQVAPRVVFVRRFYVPRWTGWTQGYGLGGSLGANGNAGGLGYGVGGTLFGFDRWLDENTIVGGFGGYAGSSVSDQLVGSHASVSAYQGGLYQLRRADRFYLSNIDAYSANDYKATRPISFGGIERVAAGSSMGNQWAHYTEAGYTIGSGRTYLQPFAGVQYIYLDQGGYSESGAGSLNLNVANQTVSSIRNNFGTRVYGETNLGWIKLIPSASARYQREWGNGTQLISSSFAGAPTTSFVTAGNSLGRNFGLFTLSTTALLSARSSLYGAFDTQIAENYAAFMGSGGFQYRW